MVEPQRVGGALEKPGNVNAAGALLLAGGIMTTLVSVGIALGTFFLWIPWIYGIIAGIYAIVKGSQLLGYNGTGPAPGVPTAAAVMLIVNVLNCDMMSMTLGIVALALLNDNQTRAYLEGNTQQGAAGQHFAQAQQTQQAQSFAQAPAQSFNAPTPSSWGPPPTASPQTIPETPSWKAQGWGSQPLSTGGVAGGSPPTLKEAPAKEAQMWEDDMDDWDRRFSEVAKEPSEAAEVAEVGAGAGGWGSSWDKDKG